MKSAEHLVPLAFVGGGNMARSLIGGLIAAGVAPREIRVADPDAAQRAACAALGAVQTTADNAEAATGARLVVLAVKPQAMRAAARGVAAAVRAARPLVVSVAAGIRTADLDRWLDGGAAIVRAMPNTPALLGAGATGLYANSAVRPEDRAAAERLMTSVGRAEWIEDEALMDAVTALSGSGPAYFFLLIEMLEAEGAKLGLPPEIARRLALQTAVGSARMAAESEEPAATLRARVTSPGGTTAAALAALESAGVRAAFARALGAARDRGRELADQFGED
jgi:pyrroline-5-carboxylate reductase